jgi:PAS domain-containing protein
LYQRAQKALFSLKPRITFAFSSSINIDQKCKSSGTNIENGAFHQSGTHCFLHFLSDRHQLVQQMQLIGGGAHGPQAATAIRHVAAQNGVWSLGNFGGVPSKSSMSFYQPATTDSNADDGESSFQADPTSQASVDTPEYRFVFNSCGIGMALASMGGAFIDCNQLFSQLSSYSKQELCALTIFNLTARQDLQHAFDLISQMISPPVDVRGQDTPPKAIVLRGAMGDRTDIGLNVSLIKGEDGIAKCFCVTLIKNPESPFDSAKPVPVSFESIQNNAPVSTVDDTKTESMSATPAFTSG